MTGDNLERALSEKSIPREIVEETRACLQECDFGRFVSASASAAKTRELSARIRKNIDAIDTIVWKASGKHPIAAFASLFLMFLLFSWNLYALPGQEYPEKLFAQGNSEYQKGDYESAERYYSQILNSGFDSGPLYYNLGNACFKQKRLGDAIYYWEKAKQKLPADREIQENLELANLLIVDRIEVSENPWPTAGSGRHHRVFHLEAGNLDCPGAVHCRQHSSCLVSACQKPSPFFPCAPGLCWTRLAVSDFCVLFVLEDI